MFIHKLFSSTSGNGGKSSLGVRNKGIARNHQRITGSGLQTAIYEGGKVHKKGDLLRTLKLAQPKQQKKYIAFE